MLSQRLVPSIFKKVSSYSVVLGQHPFIAFQIQNFYLSLTRYIMLLIVTLLLKYEVCFWIFPKRLIRYGMTG